MLARVEDAQDLSDAVHAWLTRLERALCGDDALADIFVTDGYWRDVLALTWTIVTVHGADRIAAELAAHAKQAEPRSFALATNRTPPSLVTRSGI
jgi:hypothetical protein